MTLPVVTEAQERERFLESLPWFLNQTLPASDRDWMEETVLRRPWAAEAVQREQLLHTAVKAPEPLDVNVGLQTLLDRVRSETPPKSVAASPAPSRFTAWLGWLAQPRFAAALAVIAFVQAGMIGWLLQSPDSPHGEFRSTPVTEVRTLRVTFLAGTDEPRLRAALLSAGARIVGGPNQLGEYWLASDIRSLEEMRTSLLVSKVTGSIEVDLAGPRGR